MDDTKHEPKAWVGCLACYNGGRLVGAWMDGTEANDRDAFEAAAGESPLNHDRMHEELWVMDHEDYGGLLTGECSPAEAAQLAAVVERVDGEWYDVEAVAAWRDYVGPVYADLEDLSDFEEAYAGTFDSERDYAEDLADDLGLVDEDATWPNSYIDWDAATRALFMDDNYSVDAPGGQVYVFRRY